MASEPASPETTSRPGGRPSRRWWPWLATAVLVFPALWIFNRGVPAPADLGLREGRLRDCPDRPNCAGSECSDPSVQLEPLRWTGSEEEGRERLRQVVGAMPGARLIRADGNYLHFEFTTRVCRFVDDVEFRIDTGSGRIHCRSASRVGYSDLGANRRRLEEIRRRFGT